MSNEQNDMQQRINRAYSERNALAIAFARAALAAGWPAGHGFDADATKDWDDDWRHVIYVDLPNGAQVSWHVSPDEIAILDGLPEYGGKWDGTFVAKNPSWCQFDASPKGGSTDSRALKLPCLPFAVFDEFGVGADDRVADYGRACAAAAMQATSAEVKP